MTAPLDTSIKKLREIAEAATPGPWHVPYVDGWQVCYGNKDNPRDEFLIADVDNDPQNASFIATFNPETVLRLLDTIERYEAALKDLVERIDRNGGLGDYKGGPPFALARAREALMRGGAEENKP